MDQHKLDYATPPPVRKKPTALGLIWFLIRSLVGGIAFISAWVGAYLLVRWLSH